MTLSPLMNRIIALIILPCIIYIDQATKAWAMVHATIPCHYTSWCMFVTGLNNSLAWSSETELSWIASMGVIALASTGTICVALCLAYAIVYTTAYSIPLSFILAGAISNLYDRLSVGGVIDFILLHHNDLSWPLFNIADIAISIGGIICLVFMFQERNL